MATPDNPNNWRDLADQLTAEQIKALLRVENIAEAPILTSEQAMALLKAEQIEELTPEETSITAEVVNALRPTSDELAARLLKCAHNWAQAKVLFAHAELPAGATRTRGWTSDEDGVWSRTFEGTLRKIGTADTGYPAKLLTGGVQFSNGKITRSISVTANEGLTAAEARELAAALLEAADEIERLGPR